MKTITEPSRQIPVRAEVDTLIIGGGPTGIIAAEAASMNGQKVMLLESRGFLGGNLTIGLPILSFLNSIAFHEYDGSPALFSQLAYAIFHTGSKFLIVQSFAVGDTVNDIGSCLYF